MGAGHLTWLDTFENSTHSAQYYYKLRPFRTPFDYMMFASSGKGPIVDQVQAVLNIVFQEQRRKRHFLSLYHTISIDI